MASSFVVAIVAVVVCVCFECFMSCFKTVSASPKGGSNVKQGFNVKPKVKQQGNLLKKDKL